MDATAAYRVCESITRERAANFYYGIRLLPPPKRRALCAVYALSRRIDDIGDDERGLPDEERLRLLEAVRRSVATIGTETSDPVLAALGDAADRFSIPVEAFADLVDGVEMDVRGTTYPRFEDLVVYCRRVAGSVGRLSVGVFGTADEPARAAGLADDLGVAMQLTNILRDVREDRARGRVYIPAEDLAAFGLGDDPATAPREAIALLVGFEAARAREWFSRGLELLPMLDPRSAACVRAMTGIYRRLLDRIERRPEEVLARRVALPPWEKAWVAVRSLAGGVAAGRPHRPVPRVARSPGR